MKKAAAISFEARKTPVQERSTATVEAIFEAAIQVLLEVGPARLTTTRVAQRAGVSVGTLYQYFPNKQALLRAVLEEHLLYVARSLEIACKRLRGSRLEEMAAGAATAFAEAKMHRMEASVALYRIAAELPIAELLLSIRRRSISAVAAMFKTAPDASFADLHVVSATTYAAMVGVVRATLENGATMKEVRIMREQMIVLCRSYVQAVKI